MCFKKTLSIILSIVLISGCLSTGAFATYGPREESVCVPVNNGDIYFDSDYAETGKEITVLVKERETDKFVYEWYIDNQRIENTTNSYIPQWCDLETTLTVKVFEKTGVGLVGTISMFISELPVIYIETEDREPVVIKSKELDAHIKIQGNKEFNNQDLLYEGSTIIKGRGNVTWHDTKKPYRLKLDSKADLFGMGKNKHWVLLSNPFDNTYARNIVSYNLAGEMGLDYQKFVPVELVLNGTHLGNYLICEHVRVGDNRVEITDWDDIAEDVAKEIYKANKDTMTKDERDELIDIMTDESKQWVDTDEITFKGTTYTISDYYDIPDINGGYLLCLDQYDGTYKTTHGSNLEINRPEVRSDDMYNYITGYYQAFEDALFSDDYCTQYNGQTVRYTDFIDIESFAKGFLLNEIFENADFCLGSTYLYKEIDEKFIFGPVWDMDLSSGRSLQSPVYFYYNKWATLSTSMVERFYSDPYFLNEVYEVYWEYRHTSIADMIKEDGVIDSTYHKLASSAQRDNELWEYDNSYDFECESFRQWMNNRIEWLDKQFVSLEHLYLSMSYRFSNNFTRNPQQLSLSLNDNILSLTLNDPDITDIKIYADGTLYGTTKAKRQVINYSVSRCAADALITVICYDSNGDIVCGNFISKDKQITSLNIKTLPDKLDYNVGDELDLTGLELEVTYNSSSVQSVSPEAALTYVKDAVGAEYLNCYNKVTDTSGKEVYVSLKYKNATTEFKINILPRENAQDVIEMIDKIPAKDFDNDYIEDVIKAKLAFDDLSEQAKSEVTNKDILEQAMDYIDSLAGDSFSGMVSYWISDKFQYGYVKNQYVLLIKGEPKKIRLATENGLTATLLNTSDTRSPDILSIRDFGEYKLWTCRFGEYDGTITTFYHNEGTTVSSSAKEFTTSKFADPIKKITGYEYNKSIFDGNEVSLIIGADKKFDEIRILENSEVIETVSAKKGNNLIRITPSGIGTHTYSIEYTYNGNIIKYDSFDVYVRPKVINFLFGDVDINRAINSSDALLILQYSTGLTPLDDYQFKAADTNHDSTVNSSDALRVLMFTTGNIPEL